MPLEAKLISYFFTVMLISVRVGTLWMIFPFFSLHNVPAMLKVSGAFVLSVALVPSVGPHLPAWSLDLSMSAYQLLSFVLQELFIGLGMGLVARSFFYTALASAEWLGTQIGFTVSSMFDPNTQTNESAWGSFNSILALMIFISIGGHWWCLEALVESYQIPFVSVLEIGSMNMKFAAFWIEIGHSFFFWMLKLSGPMVCVILLLQLAMGVLSKFVPQINLWTVSIPVTLSVGVLVFSLLSPMYGDVLEELFGSGRGQLYLWLKVLKGGA